MQEKNSLSLVVPVCNEEDNLSLLYEKLLQVLSPLPLSWELILVDDGSRDGSLSVMRRLREKDQRVKIISLSRNFGHMMALTAGLDFAAGDAVITLDADLQHPPELIPELVRRWQAGSEIVNTVREETTGAGWFKSWSARFFYRLINRVARLDLPAGSADYRLLDRRAVNYLKQFRERSRFLRGLIGWVGFHQEFLPYRAAARQAGKTKYSFGKMFSFALDGITSFSAAPLRLAAYLGLLVASLSFLYLAYALYAHFLTDQTIEGWTSLLVVVLFLGGLQLIFLGVIGEYLGRVFEEVKQRPLYIVREKIGL